MNNRADTILNWMPEWGGFHLAAWRAEDAPAEPTMNFEAIRQMVRLAERGKFHGVFLADSLVVGFQGQAVTPESLSHSCKGLRYHPLVLMSALAGCTERIGLLATASTTYNEPFHIARMFASLDHLSGGRAGWNIVTSKGGGESLNFGRDQHMEHTQRYERSQEFLEIVTGLWDSWEDDAFLCDKESGVYFDPDKLHAVNYHGEFLSVAGPLNIARPPQGHPVIAQAGSSEVGRAFAARNADVVYTLQADLEKGKAFYAEVKELAGGYDREPEHIKVMPALLLVAGHTQDDADEKLARLDSLVDPEVGMEQLTKMIGTDLSGVPLDGLVPEVPVTEFGSKTGQKYWLDLAKRDNLTVRQLMQVTARIGAVAGTPTSIADTIQEWVENDAADGFNITFGDAVDSLEVFVDGVIPELQRRGLFHTDYRGTTLRENLDIPRPANRFARAT